MTMEHVHAHAAFWKNRISWRSVLAGVVTTCAVSTLLTVLGIALGFTVLEPMSEHPASGLGAAFGIWSALTLIVSFAAGGFMAGYASNWRGCEHGFLNWAVVLLIGSLFTGMAVGSAVQAVGSAVKTVGSGVAEVASGAGSAASTLFDKLEENVDLDFADYRGNVLAVLRDSGVETMQPEYLRGEMRGARSDLRGALNQLRLDSANSEQVINGFLDKQKARLEKIRAGVDREAAVASLMRNTDMSRYEAERTVDNALRVISEVEYALDDAGQQMEDARQYLSQAAEQARAKAEEVSSAIAASALVAAIALIVGAVVSCFFAVLGNRRAREKYPYTI